MNQHIPNNQLTIKQVFIVGTDLFSYLLSKWLIIVVVGLVGAGLGLAYAFTKKPVYTASLSFALEDQQQEGGLSGALGLASQFGFDLGGSGGGMFASANLIELFKSRTIIEQTLLLPVTVNGKSISFAEMYIENAQWRKTWEKKPALKGIQFMPNANRQQFSRNQDSLLGVIYNSMTKSGLSVSQTDKKVDIITIELKSGSEDFAKRFTEALAKEVSDFYILTKSKKAKMNMEIVQKQTDSIRGLLNGAITDVAVANDKTFALNPALNVQKTSASKRQIDVQYNAAILTELVKQTELARVALRKETPLIQVIDRPILPLKKQSFGKLTGIIIGGLLAGMTVICWLLFRRWYKKVMI